MAEPVAVLAPMWGSLFSAPGRIQARQLESTARAGIVTERIYVLSRSDDSG
jgi:hypothetical protein